MEVGVASRVSAPLPARRVRGLLSRIARLTGSHGREVSVLFCGDRPMRSLNRRYRRRDRATDVLAFPAADGEFLGDIVVSVPYARRQARRRGEPVSREVERLLLHGFLHLSGYDHETDDGQMRALEAKLLRRLDLEDSK